MEENHLNKLLIRLGLENTVLFRNKDNSAYDFAFTSDIENKLNTIEPDAIYVFNKQPFILFFDLTEDSKRDSEIHKKVWSFDNSPIIFIIKNTEVQVFNALNYIKNKNGKDGKLEELSFSDAELESKFSFWNLQSGETWRWLHDDYLERTKKRDTRKRVNDRLFQNIKDVRKYLTTDSKSNKLDDKQANSLILRLIFIRYLIDRGIKIDDSFISGETINDKRLSFITLIKDLQNLNRLFLNLNDKFNGVLFKELDIKLDQTQADFLAQVFKGEVQEQGSLFDGFFFEIFDFSIIPVEVISGIYESLIDEETRDLNSAVYTPSFLVDYILTDTVESHLNKSQSSDCSIFEVAVGSGIFLVQSLRKMIEKEIELNGKENKEAFSNKIREIAKKNLFGIDINREALKVTCFSIYIALLDYQEPKDIEKYPFPNLLDENLFEANFFDTTHKFNEIVESVNPKFILGNPPWKSKKDDVVHINWLKHSKKTVGRFEIAQSFLLRSKDFMKAETRAALIITSTIFYNVASTTKKFKSEFLSTFCVKKILDLSPVRRLIFEQKNSPATVVHYQLSATDEYLDNVVVHHSVKSNLFLKHFKMLVIEKYDRKEILQKYFLENDWMFKVALYGNTLDFNLLRRLSFLQKKVSDKIDNETIFKGDGILKGKPKDNPFEWLVGLPIVDNSEIKQYYTIINENVVLKENDVYLESGRRIELFIGNHIYLKAQTLNESEIVVSFSDKTAVHRHDTIGITSEKMIDDLKIIYSFLITNFYTYYQYLTSSAWGVSTRPAIRLEEYLSFPLIDIDNELKNNLIKLVDDFLKPFEQFYLKFNLGQPQKDEQTFTAINKIVNRLYGIKKYEEDLIGYVLNVSRYQFQESKQHLFTQRVHSNKKLLEKYAAIYIEEFERIYDEFIQVEIFPLNHFIALNFVFLESQPEESIIYPDKKDEKEVLSRLAHNLSVEQITNTQDPTKNLFVQKDIKGFESNSFYIIKPNEYKCWHRAMAWYDIAEFKEAIQKAELKRLNSDSAND